jgi:hypothetical protein
MKKQYISPELETVRIATMQMIATSSQSLDELLTDEDVKIIPDDTPVDEFLTHGDDFVWEEE